MANICIKLNVLFPLAKVIRQGPDPIFHKWNDITNLVNHKRYFGVEFQNYENGVQFILDETESAKYVWKMCKLILFDMNPWKYSAVLAPLKKVSKVAFFQIDVEQGKSDVTM